jgi:hypothetical protein
MLADGICFIPSRHTPRKRGTQYSRAFRFHHQRSGMGRPVVPDQVEDGRRAMTIGYDFSFSRHTAPEFFVNSLRPENKEGAGKTGCALHPRSRVQICAKKRTRAYRFSGSSPAFPTQWFYGLLRAPPGDRAFLPPSPTNCSVDLTPASGRQDHTASPYVAASYVCAQKTRLT